MEIILPSTSFSEQTPGDGCFVSKARLVVTFSKTDNPDGQSGAWFGQQNPPGRQHGGCREEQQWSLNKVLANAASASCGQSTDVLLGV